MKCPKCSAELKRVRRGDVSIDACDLCYGIWLDKGELEKVSNSNASSLGKTKDALNSMKNSDSKIVEEQSYKCPKCDKEMQKVQFNTKEKIIADTCSACEGMWFDSGEMIAVTDAVEDSGAGSAPAKKQSNVSLLPSIMAIIAVVAIVVALIMWGLGYLKQ